MDSTEHSSCLQPPLISISDFISFPLSVVAFFWLVPLGLAQILHSARLCSILFIFLFFWGCLCGSAWIEWASVCGVLCVHLFGPDAWQHTIGDFVVDSPGEWYDSPTHGLRPSRGLLKAEWLSDTRPREWWLMGDEWRVRIAWVTSDDWSGF